MNVAGRKMVESISTSFRPGPSVRARLDVPGHRQRVRVRLLLDDQQQAGAIVDDGVADRRGKPSDLGHVAERERRAVAEGDGHLPQVVGASERGLASRRCAGSVCR